MTQQWDCRKVQYCCDKNGSFKQLYLFHPLIKVNRWLDTYMHDRLSSLYQFLHIIINIFRYVGLEFDTHLYTINLLQHTVDCYE